MSTALALLCGLATILVAAPVRADHDETLALDEAADPDEVELDGLPLIGGDTDNGFGLGAMGTIAGIAPNVAPYRWRLEFGLFYATKGGVFSPSYEDAYVLLTLPHLMNDQLRLEIRPSFTKDTTLRYYGLGNQALDFSIGDPARDDYQRIHPGLAVNATWKLSHPWYVLVGTSYVYNRLSYSSTGTLAMAMTSSDPFVRNSLRLDTDHSVLRVQTALIYDTRDNEIAPHRGQYHQLELRESPRLGEPFPYSYQQLDAQARFYYTPIPRYLTLAARGVFDLQIGDVPFYELSRYEDTSAIGGALGVRGVPAYRFYGKVKAFANFEARSETFHLRIYDKPYIVGFAVFFDIGRLWSEIAQAHPELDGTGLGMHYGIGGGLRLQEGKAYVVRADVAWSPDARPIGLYLSANHIF